MEPFSQSKRLTLENAIFQSKYMKVTDKFITFSVLIQHSSKDENDKWVKRNEYIQCFIGSNETRCTAEFKRHIKYLENEQMPLVNIEGFEKRKMYVDKNGDAQEKATLYIDKFIVNNAEEKKNTELEDIPF